MTFNQKVFILFSGLFFSSFVICSKLWNLDSAYCEESTGLLQIMFIYSQLFNSLLCLYFCVSDND